MLLSLVLSLLAAAPQVGSPNTAVADPDVPRPESTPCRVTLFEGVTFADFSGKSFGYTPPSDCPGPWEKIVLEGDFAVSAGRQFDRTANLWLGGVNIFFGTTPEPSRDDIAPLLGERTWHVERDLTDYAPLFAVPQAGEADIGNLVNSTYTGIINGAARLVFYPLEHGGTSSADLVLPLSAGANGGTVGLGSGADSLTRTFALPRNIERAYLDVVAESQYQDEFWYLNVPNDVAAELGDYGCTSFRETQVAIDGKPAGVAPVYPWIYTGGIDPYLWRPIPGVQALNFVPVRVDLTPFAGVLSDGTPHSVGLSVTNACNYFSATATLLLYLDRGSSQVTGAVTANTIGAPAPVVQESLVNGSDGSIKGTITVTSTRNFTVTGWVKTSHGKVQTSIAQSIGFSSVQTIDYTSAASVQNALQSTSIDSVTTRRGGEAQETVRERLRWPLKLDYDFINNADGSYAQVVSIDQGYQRSASRTREGDTVSSYLSNQVSTGDTLSFSPSFRVTGHAGARSSQHYFGSDSEGRCYSRSIAAAQSSASSTHPNTDVLVSIVDGQGCEGD